MKLLAQIHINCNALHYGPKAPLQINLLTYYKIKNQNWCHPKEPL